MAPWCRLFALLLAFCLCSSFVYADDNEDKDALLRRVYENPALQPGCSVIAKGGFGAVYACTLDGELRAVKFVPAHKMTRDAAQYECEMAQLAVRNTERNNRPDKAIINCYNFFYLSSEKSGKDEWYITTMDYYPNAIPLDKYIENWYPTMSIANKKSGAIEVIRKAVYIWTELVMVLAKLTDPKYVQVGITHHDIKPANILYDPIKQQIYLIDWGASYTCEEKNKDKGDQYSALYGDVDLRFGYIEGKCGAYDIYSAVSVPLAILFGDSGELLSLRKFVIAEKHQMREWFEIHQIQEFIANYLCKSERDCVMFQDRVWVARECLTRFSLLGSAVSPEEKIQSTVEQVLAETQTTKRYQPESADNANAKYAAEAVTRAIAQFFMERKAEFWHKITVQIAEKKWFDLYSLLSNPLLMFEHRLDANAIVAHCQSFWETVNSKDTLRKQLVRSASQHFNHHIGLLRAASSADKKPVNILGEDQ